MSTIREIENAIEQLSKEEFKNFRTWFAQYEANAWDLQIADNIESGKLDVLANEALSELQNGKATKL
ncbi:MAG: hypothetical protein RBT69_10875 [Spirochaetia bacterium]|jgi:hypothetical protein|nr:hypothetical protein [Spirochaetia bacterium]